MRKKLAAIVVTAVMAASFAGNAGAVSTDAASAYVDAMATRALDALRAKDDRIARFGRLMIASVDFETISKGALGRSGRRMPKDKVTELSRLLAALVVNNAADRLRDAEVTGFTIGKARLLPNQEVLVKAVIEFASEKPLETGWRVAQRGGGPRIVDIELHGNSLRIHYMNRFKGLLRFDGIDGLIKSLRRKVDGTPGLEWVQEAALPDAAADPPPSGDSGDAVAAPDRGGAGVYPR